MNKDVLFFNQIDKASLPYVGGKGANLGELTKSGFLVPEGFCVTTYGYNDFIQTSTEVENYFKSLDTLDVEQLDNLSELGAKIRNHLNTLTIPKHLEDSILEAWKKIGKGHYYAVRSSATAEDLPSASFAGQQDTYLNIKGEEQLINHVRKCWASLFTDRAIAYRMKNGFDHRKVFLSVVVQKMVTPDVSGIMFTADPITGHRKIVSIDASYGLGEALVSGIVTPDLYQVKDNTIIKKQIAEKKIAIYSLSDGGTVTEQIPVSKQKEQALKDNYILELAKLGKGIEEHYGFPQDIEWGLADNKLYILQSRPITSLYPAPSALDNQLHVYLSFGHQQMMTDALKPMGISVMKTVFPFGKDGTSLSESKSIVDAGGRIYADLTGLLAIKRVRKNIVKLLYNFDYLIANAISEVIQRQEFLQKLKTDKNVKHGLIKFFFPILSKLLMNLLFRNPKLGLQKVEAHVSEKVNQYKQDISNKAGAERLKAVQENLGSLLLYFFQVLFPYPFTGVVTFKIIEALSHKWLGDVKEIQLINKSLPGNVTTEMGLALGDVADIARHYPEVLAYLNQVKNNDLFAGLDKVRGGKEFKIAFTEFIDTYGMRCPGEIDITRTRWNEAPEQLIPAIFSHVQSYKPGEHRSNFQAGSKEAEQAASELINRLKKTPGGFIKARLMSRMIKAFRNLMALREHPKFMLIQIFDISKKVILEETRDLMARGILNQEKDVYYLTLPELISLVGNDQNKETINSTIAKRKEDFARYSELTPPRVMTSDGEIITGRYNVDAPEGALIGSPVSAGIIEGRARVVLKPEEAKLEKGDILVAPFTDPGWTPLFLSAKGLVLEVGGLMTHGAVVAREYGIPAVVGVENATKQIKDGQIIRVNGELGYVEIVSGNKGE